MITRVRVRRRPCWAVLTMQSSVMEKLQLRAGQAGSPPFFKPWVGSRAAAGLATKAVYGTKIHVLGESHYDRGGPDSYEITPSLTQQVVSDWALGASGSAFFTRVASIVLNQEPGSFDRAAAWQDFAYSNFVQSPVLGGPRISPARDAWAEAREAFFGQLAITRPKILVVLGSRCWNQLPSKVGAAAPSFHYPVSGGCQSVSDAWIYPHWVDGELLCTLALKVVHPSAGFGRWNWKVAADRVQMASICHSNILEHFYDHYRGVGDRPFWS